MRRHLFLTLVFLIFAGVAHAQTDAEKVTARAHSYFTALENKDPDLAWSLYSAKMREDYISREKHTSEYKRFLAVNAMRRDGDSTVTFYRVWTEGKLVAFVETPVFMTGYFMPESRGIYLSRWVQEESPDGNLQWFLYDIQVK